MVKSQLSNSKSTVNSALVCKSSPFWRFSSIHNCFDCPSAMNIFSELLQLCKMASHLHLNHAQYKKDVQSVVMEGKLTVQKTNRKFSKIRLDHNQEQLNGKIKGVGGPIGLTKNDRSSWRVSKPFASLMRLNILHQLKNDVQEHHDSNEGSQAKFVNDVLQPKKAFKEFGNPFLDNNSDLISFETNTFGSKVQIQCFYDIKVTGKQQFKDCWNKAVVNN